MKSKNCSLFFWHKFTRKHTVKRICLVTEASISRTDTEIYSCYNRIKSQLEPRIQSDKLNQSFSLSLSLSPPLSCPIWRNQRCVLGGGGGRPPQVFINYSLFSWSGKVFLGELGQVCLPSLILLRSNGTPNSQMLCALIPFKMFCRRIMEIPNSQMQNTVLPLYI